MVREMQIGATNAYSSALSGILAAQRRLDDDADRIAHDPFDVDALVESTWQPLAVQANAQVLRALDESTGALIDVLG
jgi:hypothetical protein